MDLFQPFYVTGQLSRIILSKCVDIGADVHFLLPVKLSATLSAIPRSRREPELKLSYSSVRCTVILAVHKSTTDA